MLDRQKRLNEVYEHLHNHFGVHTKGEFADIIKYARAYISSAINGNEKYLTDKLFTNICEAFPGVFDLHYLLTGEGSLLTVEEETHDSDMKKAATPPTDEMTPNILELYARMIRGVDDLRIQLKDELEEIRAIKSELQQERENLREATYRLTKAIDRINNNRSSISRLDIAAEQN